MKKSTAAAVFILVLGTFYISSAATQSPSNGKLPEAPAAKPQNPPPAASPFKDPKEKLSYAVGIFLAGRVKPQADEFDPSLVAQGLKDGLSDGKSLMTEEDAAATITQWQTEMRAKEAEKQTAFLTANKTKEGVVALPSGLQYKILTAGTGPKPTAEDTVACNYKGTLVNGTEFDSSAKHGGPATFPVSGVIKGWTEALQMMPVGSKWQLFIPANLAYGEGGRPGIPPNSTLIFEVELVSIQPKEKPNPPAK